MGDVALAGDSWVRRVGRCSALWAVVFAAAAAFDIAADATGNSATGLPPGIARPQPGWPSVGVLGGGALSLILVMMVFGVVSGTFQPRRIDITRLEMPMPAVGQRLVTPPDLVRHSIRRAMAAAPYVSATTCAVLTGLLSVTTDIVQDDSPSTLGATGGFAVGAICGFLLALIVGPIVGIAAGAALDRGATRLRSTSITLTAAVITGIIPVAVLLDIAPDETPGPVKTATVITFLAACAVATDLIVRWRYRTDTQR